MQAKIAALILASAMAVAGIAGTVAQGGASSHADGGSSIVVVEHEAPVPYLYYHD
jgi:hypothetical protein